MKSKIIVILVLIQIICSCSFAAPNQYINITQLSNEWDTDIEAYSTSSVFAVLKSTDNQYHKTVITTTIPSTYYKESSPIYCQNIKTRGDDNILVRFTLLTDYETSIYTFNTNSVYLTDMYGKAYNLQAKESSSSSERIGLGKRIFHFKSPLICENLEGAVFELRGLYKDGVELPPIKFRINYK